MPIVVANVSGFDNPFPASAFEARSLGGLTTYPVLRD